MHARTLGGPLRSRLLAAFAACVVLPSSAAALTVSAASSLTNAMREVVPLFEAEHPGARVKLNLGASGALLAQISRGAPVDVFVSADVETMDQAQARGLVQPAQRRDVLANALVVIVPVAAPGASGTPGTTGTAGSPGHAGVKGTAGQPRAPHPPRTLQDLAGPGYARIAIGLPASVPAGRYAKDVLETAQLWSAIQPRMITAHTVRQALDYVARGEVDAGFVYATDAALMPDKVRVAFTVPTARPIVYPAAVLAASPHPQAAMRFVEFLASPAAQAVFMRHGFARP